MRCNHSVIGIFKLLTQCILGRLNAYFRPCKTSPVGPRILSLLSLFSLSSPSCPNLALLPSLYCSHTFSNSLMLPVEWLPNQHWLSPWSAWYWSSSTNTPSTSLPHSVLTLGGLTTSGPVLCPKATWEVVKGSRVEASVQEPRSGFLVFGMSLACWWIDRILDNDL